jgi:hypothetical protein
MRVSVGGFGSSETKDRLMVQVTAIRGVQNESSLDTIPVMKLS